MLIDTHAHLNDEAFANALPDVLSRAEAAGVARTIVIGIDAASSQKAVDLAGKWEPLYAAVGIQPNSLGEAGDQDWERILQLVNQPKVVAVGETGLDRYWNFAPIDRQREFFARHLELAHAIRLPVVIHCREAETDVVEALSSFADRIGQPIAGVMHSFTGDESTASKCLDLGLHVSFAGMVTFKKSDGLRQVAATVPLDRLLIETDSPYLSPHPLRGKQNEPAHLVHTAACLATLFGLSLSDFAAATTANASRLFRLPV